jgi:hypothetical protein
MRENRPYGSEGGEAKAFPTPIRGTWGDQRILDRRVFAARASVHPRQDLLERPKESLPPALGALVKLRLIRPEP